MNEDELNDAALHAAQDDLRRMLTDFIKAGLVPADETAVARWRENALRIRDSLKSRLAALTEADVHLDTLWAKARQEAQNDPLVQAEETMKPVLQAQSLFTLAELMAPDFSFEAAAARIRVSAATG